MKSHCSLKPCLMCEEAVCDECEDAARVFSEFERDCLRWRGRLLTGTHKHWCHDWDFLPVDETCSEYESCKC